MSPGRLRCGVVADTSALVLVGGSTGEAGLDETLFGFPDPSTGTFSTWTTGPALPAHRFGAAVVATGGHLFAFGGYIDSVMSPPSDKVYVGSFCR